MKRTSAVLAEDFSEQPYWWEAAPPEDASAVPIPEQTDIAIIGSGYTGLCCALELAQSGVKPLVLEAGPLGTGASTRSGGMVTGGQKLVVSGAIRHLDPQRQAWMLEDAGESLHSMEERVARHQLDADYVRYGRLILAAVPNHMQRLELWARLLREHAKSAVSLIRRPELGTEIGSARYHGALLIEDYGGVHPAKYHRALREAARQHGAVLASHAAVTAIARDGNAFMVQTSRGAVRAREVVVGTNGYTGRIVPYLRRRTVPVTAYVVATEPLPPGMPERLVPHHRMMSDTQRDLYWMRLSPDGTRMIFGARPRIRDVDARTAAGDLHRMMAGVWPELNDYRIACCWTGFVGMTADHIPHMGVHDGVHYAVGCNGSGVAMMSYLGTQMARKLLGQQNRPCAFDSDAFPAAPPYYRKPWFVPIVAGWYRLQDRIEHARAQLG